jgi:hypothetical protein
MQLYHGTNIHLKNPTIIQPNRALDFGAGFYTTSDIEQARSWAHVVVKRSGNGTPLLNVYTLDKNFISLLKVKHFETANKEWLNFITEHRLNKHVNDDFDLIIGPVANDSTMPVIQSYITAIQNNDEEQDFFAEFALRQLRSDRLKDQFVFKTELALQQLTFMEVQQL